MLCAPNTSRTAEILRQYPELKLDFTSKNTTPLERGISTLGMYQKKRSEFLNQEFLRVATSQLDNPNYIVAEEFNLKLDPAIRRAILSQTIVNLGSLIASDPDLRTAYEADNIIAYGIPTSGNIFAPIFADDIMIPFQTSRKSLTIPGSWKNVLTVETHSYTTPDDKALLHFEDVSSGSTALIFDDVLGSGRAAEDVILAFQNAGVNVIGLGVIFSKLFEGGFERIEELGIPVSSPVQIKSSDENGIKLAVPDYLTFQTDETD